MANWVHKTTVQYLDSNDPPVADQVNWLKNPNLSAVAGLPQKYWKVVSNAVQAMSGAERSAVDAAAVTAARTADKARFDSERIALALALVMLDEVNALRAAVVPSLPARTQNQLVNAIKAKLDTL
jgi:hypothetical protein